MEQDVRLSWLIVVYCMVWFTVTGFFLLFCIDCMICLSAGVDGYLLILLLLCVAQKDYLLSYFAPDILYPVS